MARSKVTVIRIQRLAQGPQALSQGADETQDPGSQALLSCTTDLGHEKWQKGEGVGGESYPSPVSLGRENLRQGSFSSPAGGP